MPTLPLAEIWKREPEVEVEMSKMSDVPPWMARVVTGVMVPMPTLPPAVTVSIWVLEEEATVKMGVVGRVEEPWTVSKAVGVVEFKER